MKKLISLFFQICLLVLIVRTSFSTFENYTKKRTLQKKNQEKEIQVREDKLKKRELESIISSENGSKKAERILRDKLNFHKEGETTYRIIEKEDVKTK